MGYSSLDADELSKGPALDMVLRNVMQIKQSLNIADKTHTSKLHDGIRQEITQLKRYARDAGITTQIKDLETIQNTLADAGAGLDQALRLYNYCERELKEAQRQGY